MAEIDDELLIILATIANACYLEAAALLQEEEEQSKPRSSWRKSRDSGGNIQFLLKEYKLFDDSFIRMDQKCFLDILSFIKKDIERTDTCMRKCIPVEKKLAATLRFLTTGETLKEIAENSKLSPSYLHSAVIEVCTAIYRNMQSEFLRFPDSTEKWLEVASDFGIRWQFPLCLGALDAKHIAFKPKKKTANLFYNYKGFTSVVLLALADANCKFLFIDVGCNGQTSDDEVLDRSDLMYVLDKDCNFPEPKVIGNNRTLPYIIVADNAFPNGKRILTPYSRSNLSREEITFNTRLSHARKNVERAFGILSNRFHILQTQIQYNEINTTVIVKACCVLHNFLIHYNKNYTENIDFNNANTDTGSQNAPTTRNFNNRNYEWIRSEFTEYFCNEGIT